MEIVIIIAAFIAMGLLLLAAYLMSRATHTPAKELPRSVQNSLSPNVCATIAMAIENLRDLSYEAEYLIDKDGDIIFEQTQCNSKTIEFTNEQIAYMVAHPGLISIHNHDTDTPPSVMDLSFAARTRQGRLIVVSPHYVYTVEPSVNGWKGDDALEAIRQKHMRLFNIVNRSERFAGFDRDGAILMMTEIEYETTDAAMAVIAEKLGYHYAREDA